MKKRFFLLILIVIAIGIIWKHDALLTSLGLGSEEIDASDRAQVTVKVITQPVQITSNDRTFRAVGTGRAKLSIGIYPAVSEEVTDIYFVAQQDVKKGDILVQLDSRAEELAVKAVNSSQRSFTQAETLYQQGLISFLDVVDAQRVLASAEQALARERTNYSTQIAILFRVLGVNVELDSD